MSGKLLVYTEEVSDRLDYIVSLLFHDLLGLQPELTDNRNVYEHSALPGINYSSDTKLRGIHIQPQGLLNQLDINPIQASRGQDYHGIPTLLLNKETSFDLLSSSFFMVSRYEEYLPYKEDAHRRFPSEESCLKQLDLLKRPLVNEWALALFDELKKQFPDIQAQVRDFEYLSTIDIDQAWKFKNKGLIRNVGGFVRDILKGEWSEVAERLRVFSGIQTDPFYNYDWQDNLHARFKTQVQYFVQIGANGQFDKNISLKCAPFRKLIKRLDQQHSAGIHPSYQSNENPDIVRAEHQALSNLLGYQVKVSRQHYLMHKMPETYQNLLKIGITSDHTLGYSTDTGFRAGIAAPFCFFDLSTNQKTSLLLIPFCYMDITPLHYDLLTVEEAKQDIRNMMDRVHRVGGLFVSLWHNESLSESGRWKGWRTLYEEMISYADSIRNGKS